MVLGEHRAGICRLLGNVTVSAYCWLSSLALVVFMGTADVDLNSSFLFAFSLVPRAPPTGGAGRYGDHSEVQQHLAGVDLTSGAGGLSSRSARAWLWSGFGITLFLL